MYDCIVNCYISVYLFFFNQNRHFCLLAWTLIKIEEFAVFSSYAFYFKGNKKKKEWFYVIYEEVIVHDWTYQKWSAECYAGDFSLGNVLCKPVEDTS